MGAAGRGRRHREDRKAAIGSRDRLALDGAVMGEVVHRHPPARRLHRVDDLSRHRAGIEPRRALRGDRFQSGGEIVEGDVVADLRRASVRLEVDAGCGRMLRQDGRGRRQRIGEVVVHRQPLAGERDRGRDKLGEGELARAVFAPGELEARHRARHADSQARPARLERIGFTVGVEEHVLGRRRRRRLAIVDGDRLAEIGAVDQHEAAAADIAGARQGDREREADRHRRIDRIAAEAEHVPADPGGGRLLRDHHAVPCGDRKRGRRASDDRLRVGERHGGRQKKRENGQANGLQHIGLLRRSRSSDWATTGSARTGPSSLANIHDAIAGKAGREPAHVGRGDRDAAGGRGQAGTRNMEEDRAALALGAAREILVEHEDQVVETVLAPHPVGAVGGRQADRPVVARARRILGPALVGPQRLQRNAPGQRAPAVRAIVGPEERKSSGRRAPVALALEPYNPGRPERAGDADRAGGEPAFRPVDGQRSNAKADNRANVMRRRRLLASF